ncbi:hypothetical protein [Asticcacaulis taihuensis]|uniref:hypothetical protein n=1 Tax=Asticcacaulis taihuensis TaxID=260084 RepID=UPI003F68BF13
MLDPNENDGTPDADDVLRRMLNTPPKPHEFGEGKEKSNELRSERGGEAKPRPVRKSKKG